MQMQMNSRSYQSALLRTIGQRMKTARELCNLSQVKAAKRLGYQNSSKLSRVESGIDSGPVPLWLIVRAAAVYDVSIDYLFGVSNEFDADLQRGVSEWLIETWEKARLRDVESIRKLHKKVSAMEAAIHAMLDANKDVSAALNRFSELNPEFEDMRAGNRLCSSVERASDAAKTAHANMARFKCECAIAARESAQLSLI